jgi:tRNA G10  N-methylase Trm11
VLLLHKDGEPIIRSVHPFPARMAPSIAWQQIPECGPKLTVLDPMAGSGTVPIVGKLRGHSVIGVDSDPLAVLISKTACSHFRSARLMDAAEQVLARAIKIRRQLPLREAYPVGVDEETQSFVRFWFDEEARLQLGAASPW